jgi:hypothetical protein
VGYYGWNVIRGCWYVKVEAPGYFTHYSAVVGVLPEVTDLDIALEPWKKDAERWRWLMKTGEKKSGQLGLTVEGCTRKDFEAIADAAMKEKP